MINRAVLLLAFVVPEINVPCLLWTPYDSTFIVACRTSVLPLSQYSHSASLFSAKDSPFRSSPLPILLNPSDYLALPPQDPTLGSPDVFSKTRVAIAIKRHCIAFNAEFKYSKPHKVGRWGRGSVELFERMSKGAKELPRSVRMGALLMFTAIAYSATVTFIITVPNLVGRNTLKVFR